MGAEINYWKALGLEEPKEGANEAEVAELPEQPEGGNEAELALQPDDGEDVETEQETEPGTNGEDPAEETEERPEKPQSKQERARQAADRRRREQEAAIQAAVDAALQQERSSREQELKDFFAAVGMKDPNRGNQPITSMEEFRQYQQSFAMKQAEAELKRGKLTPETLQQIVAQTPAIQQAQQIIQQAEREKQQAEQMRVQAQVDAEIAEIGKLDPTIKSMQDLLASERGQQVYEYVKKGNNLVDAYRLANFEKLTSKAMSAATAQATARAQSKEHLQQTTARGQGGAEVPAAEMALYRQMMPQASEAEIRRHYDRYIKSRK